MGRLTAERFVQRVQKIDVHYNFIGETELFPEYRKEEKNNSVTIITLPCTGSRKIVLTGITRDR